MPALPYVPPLDPPDPLEDVDPDVDPGLAALAVAIIAVQDGADPNRAVSIASRMRRAGEF